LLIPTRKQTILEQETPVIPLMTQSVAFSLKTFWSRMQQLPKSMPLSQELLLVMVELLPKTEVSFLAPVTIMSTANPVVAAGAVDVS